MNKNKIQVVYIWDDGNNVDITVSRHGNGYTEHSYKRVSRSSDMRWHKSLQKYPETEDNNFYTYKIREI